MILRQPDATIFAWWLKQKRKKFTVNAEMTALLDQIVAALESGEGIEVRGSGVPVDEKETAR